MLTWLKRVDKVVMVDDVSLTLNFGNERSSSVDADLDNSNHGRPPPDCSSIHGGVSIFY